MFNTGTLTENGKIVTLLQPVSVSNAAKDSLYVSMRNWKRLLIVIEVGANAGSSTNHIAVTLTQSTSNAGAGSKSLSFDKMISELVSQSVDTPVINDVTSDTFNIIAGTANVLYMVEILDTQLDLANGFEFVNVHLAASGESAAIVIGILGVFYSGDYAGKPTTLPSVVSPSPA